MDKIREDTIGGFNAFLNDQRDEDGTATVTLFDFDSTVERMYHAKPIEQASELNEETYTPGGQTALHDAITTAIDDTDAYVTDQERDGRPDNVIVVVLTDGKENASETPQDVVRDRVEARREEADWEFLFIGANQDAALTAGKMGMSEDKSLSMKHSGDGTRAAYESTSESISRARRQGETGGYTDEDRDRQDTAGNS